MNNWLLFTIAGGDFVISGIFTKEDEARQYGKQIKDEYPVTFIDGPLSLDDVTEQVTNRRMKKPAKPLSEIVTECIKSFKKLTP